MTPIVEETSEKTEKEQTEEEVIEQEEAIKPVKKTRKREISLSDYIRKIIN